MVVVGFSLGLVGGGGSILAVPLLIYLVGVPSTHVAIGTSALAVAVSAAANVVQHARRGAVKWRCAFVFAAAGVLGAFAGWRAAWSKTIDGQKLLVFFAILMLVVAGLMLRRSAAGRRQRGRAAQPQERAETARAGARDGWALGLFRDWGWLSHRAGADARNRHADPECSGPLRSSLWRRSV